MAPKRSPLDDPPARSSSEEEETSSGEEETSTGEEEDPPMVSQPQLQASSSESGSGYGSGSGSESDSAAEKNVKPSASKPMENTPKRQKLPQKADMSVKSLVKSPSQSASKTKRAKKDIEARLDDAAVADLDSNKSVEDSKKLFQRIWSEEDEIVLLKGISDYKAKKGVEPTGDMNDFHKFIKKYLHIDVLREQLRNKVRRLKMKYKNNKKRGKKGADPTFTKPHEQEAFELSKKLWGAEVETPLPEQPMFNGTPRKRRRASSSKSLKEEPVGMQENVKENHKMPADGNLAPSESLNELLDFNKNRGVIGLPESVVKRGLELIDESKKAEFEGQWRNLHIAELELFVRRTELVRDQAMVILKACQSSNK